MMRALVTALLLCALTACVTITAVEEEETPRTPRRFDVEAPGSLTPTDTPGVLSAQELGANTYFDQNTEYWCRFAYGEWFMAFTFDGAWFPYPDNELPPYLASFQKQETPKTVKQQLEDLERQLEDLNREDASEAEASPPR